jgi:hypothetical protein
MEHVVDILANRPTGIEIANVTLDETEIICVAFRANTFCERIQVRQVSRREICDRNDPPRSPTRFCDRLLSSA